MAFDGCKLLFYNSPASNNSPSLFRNIYALQFSIFQSVVIQMNFWRKSPNHFNLEISIHDQTFFGGVQRNLAMCPDYVYQKYLAWDCVWLFRNTYFYIKHQFAPARNVPKVYLSSLFWQNLRARNYENLSFFVQKYNKNRGINRWNQNRFTFRYKVMFCVKAQHWPQDTQTKLHLFCSWTWCFLIF